MNYPGVFVAPPPVLLAEDNYLRELQQVSSSESEIIAMPFSALAQSCRTCAEYRERILSTSSEHIELVAIGVVGPKLKINRLTGKLKLYR